MNQLGCPYPGARGEVVGIGIDMVELAEVRQALDEQGESYLRHLFTAAELAQSSLAADPVPRLGALFAAKEATLKALGTEGLKPPWTALEVLGHAGSSSAVALSGAALDLARQRGVAAVTVSTTCDEHKAAAVAVATAAP